MSVKRLFIRVTCAAACILAASLQSVAQSSPADSLVFDSVTAYAGESAVVTARLMNSHTLHVLAVPLTYPADLMTLDSVVWVSERVLDLPILSWNVDRETGFVYLSAAATEEPYLATGRDILARFHFTVRADAPDDSRGAVDTAGFTPEYPLTVRSLDMVDQPLFFTPGAVRIYRINHPPVLQVQAQQYVNEGEQLAFVVGVDDADGDSVSLAVAGAPTGAIFTRAADQEYSFMWTPDYSGPNSSAASPFSIRFLASDGESSVAEDVQIWVGNVNRPPELSTPTPVSSVVQEPVLIVIRASDPDGDPLEIYTLNDLDGDTITGSNPWTFQWTPARADVGWHSVRFVCEDDYGAADTVAVAVTVESVIDYTLGIEFIEAPSGQFADVAVFLFNRVAVGGADLTINYDPTALTFKGIERAGLGMESWEFFDVGENNAQVGRNIHIVGIADMDNDVYSPALPPSDTILFTLRFLVSEDAELFDQSVPLTFPMLSETDNILSTSTGESVFHEDIEYSPGGVLILEPVGYLIGDINLNSVAFEIGDAVRLSGYFINGDLLDPVQRANSDCNQDGRPATIADLVFLINKIAE